MGKHRERRPSPVWGGSSWQHIANASGVWHLFWLEHTQGLGGIHLASPCLSPKV